jgi:hypothetical protein
MNSKYIISTLFVTVDAFYVFVLRVVISIVNVPVFLSHLHGWAIDAWSDMV